MKILVVGGGGREDVLCWKLAHDEPSAAIYCAPGNAGTARHAANLDISADDVPGLVRWASVERPDLTIVGPEGPLCAGLVDELERAGLRAFGPSRAAAQLEGSKVFSKDVMEAAGVPTAKAKSFTDAAVARAYLDESGIPVVIKAEGLAAGKGVSVCLTRADAESAIDAALVSGAFGEAGRRILIEEFLTGEEASILALVDGEHVVLLASAQDHKRVFDGDAGPNTGGMGAYSPAPVVRECDLEPIRRQVFLPVLQELRRRGIRYKGVMYGGLMMSAEGFKVLEFNSRFGDPEAQVVIPRMSCPLRPALEACIDGTLSEAMVTWQPSPCVCVVMASGGYPGSFPKGLPIRGLAEAATIPEVVVFHAGTALREGQVVTTGGRVLNVTARASDLRTAIRRAYDAVGKITFERAHFRRDIGARALVTAVR